MADEVISAALPTKYAQCCVNLVILASVVFLGFDGTAEATHFYDAFSAQDTHIFYKELEL